MKERIALALGRTCFGALGLVAVGAQLVVHSIMPVVVVLDWLYEPPRSTLQTGRSATCTSTRWSTWHTR